MKKFFLKLTLFFLLLFLLDRVIGGLCEYYFFQTRDGDTGGQINSLLKKECQVVVFGSSKAESQYAPHVLGQILGKTVFNAGFKASNCIYDYGVEQLVFNTYKPQLVVYDLTQVSLYKADFNIYEKLYPLYPFWRKPFIWELIKHKDPFEGVFFFSRIYPYNSKVHSIILFNILKKRPGVNNGYKPQPEVMDPSTQPETKEIFDAADIDGRLLDYFKKFVLSARDKGIKIVVVRSPRYFKESCPLPDEIASFLKANGVPVLDYSPEKYPQFIDYKLYHDRYHLNQKGSELFSTLAGNDLKKLIKN